MQVTHAPKKHITQMQIFAVLTNIAACVLEEGEGQCFIRYTFFIMFFKPVWIRYILLHIWADASSTLMLAFLLLLKCLFLSSCLKNRDHNVTILTIFDLYSLWGVHKLLFSWSKLTLLKILKTSSTYKSKSQKNVASHLEKKKNEQNR